MICFPRYWAFMHLNFSWHNNGTLPKDHTENTTPKKGNNNSLFKNGDPQNPYPIGRQIPISNLARILEYLSVQRCSPYVGVPLGPSKCFENNVFNDYVVPFEKIIPKDISFEWSNYFFCF